MSDENSVAAAVAALRDGDFDRAWELYGRLVELFPADPDYTCGLYSAGYWRNRADSTQAQKAGRSRGNYLKSEWDEFQRTAEERSFEGCQSYQAVMHHILGGAAEEFRQAFNEEGGRAVDPDLLVDLSKCLLRIEDYKNALDILYYTRRLYPEQNEILFLLAETLSSTPGQEEAGLAHYRDAFLADPAAVDPTLIGSKQVADVFRKLYDQMDRKVDRVRDWLPAYFQATYFGRGGRRIAAADVEHVAAEVQRLELSRNNLVDRFKDRVQARLAFYYLILLEETTTERDQDATEDIETRLRDCAAEVHTLYKETRKKKRDAEATPGNN